MNRKMFDSLTKIERFCVQSGISAMPCKYVEEAWLGYLIKNKDLVVKIREIGVGERHEGNIRSARASTHSSNHTALKHLTRSTVITREQASFGRDRLICGGVDGEFKVVFLLSSSDLSWIVTPTFTPLALVSYYSISYSLPSTVTTRVMLEVIWLLILDRMMWYFYTGHSTSISHACGLSMKRSICFDLTFQEISISKCLTDWLHVLNFSSLTSLQSQCYSFCLRCIMQPWNPPAAMLKGATRAGAATYLHLLFGVKSGQMRRDISVNRAIRDAHKVSSHWRLDCSAERVVETGKFSDQKVSLSQENLVWWINAHGSSMMERIGGARERPWLEREVSEAQSGIPEF